jgi:putative hydrolase of the HAD superfamily
LAEEATFFHGYWNAIADEVGVSPAIRARLRAFDYTTCMRAYPDARPALAWGRAQGCRIGVLSNFSLASLEPSLAAAGLGDLVDVACAATVIGAAKPQPAAYLAVCRMLQVAPEATLFFDDEVACVEGARQVGMHAWLVDRARHTHGLEDGVAADLTALPEIWQRLAQSSWPAQCS